MKSTAANYDSVAYSMKMRIPAYFDYTDAVQPPVSIYWRLLLQQQHSLKKSPATVQSRHRELNEFDHHTNEPSY
jgi:hypothetical protein